MSDQEGMPRGCVGCLAVGFYLVLLGGAWVVGYLSGYPDPNAPLEPLFRHVAEYAAKSELARRSLSKFCLTPGDFQEIGAEEQPWKYRGRWEVTYKVTKPGHRYANAKVRVSLDLEGLRVSPPEDPFQDVSLVGFFPEQPACGAE